MHVRLCFSLIALAATAAVSSSALSQSITPVDSFTLQVASFPAKELADRFVIRLVEAGEHPICSTVELQGRGEWTRVFVGLFTTSESARRYGERLMARGLVTEFLVRKAELSQQATRPRRVVQGDDTLSPGKLAVTGSNLKVSGLAARATDGISGASKNEDQSEFPETRLPVLKANGLKFAPTPDIDRMPRPDPVMLAMALVTGEGAGGSSAKKARGGLWLTGNAAEGMARLRWMVGEENEHLIRLDLDGRVWIDKNGLRRAAGLEAARVDDPLVAARFIASNEGLLLITQLSQGNWRYRLHIGAEAPTMGKTLSVSGSVNLDNNFDSRINPYRRDGKKLENERPPEGFDSLVALNPVARWYNLTTNEWVPAGEIVFHELAEAHAKVELGYDYLLQGARPGAHALALERERLLKVQRPGDDIVLTAGTNRVLRSQEEIRLFFADNAGGISQR